MSKYVGPVLAFFTSVVIIIHMLFACLEIWEQVENQKTLTSNGNAVYPLLAVSMSLGHSAVFLVGSLACVIYGNRVGDDTAESGFLAGAILSFLGFINLFGSYGVIYAGRVLDYDRRLWSSSPTGEGICGKALTDLKAAGEVPATLEDVDTLCAMYEGNIAVQFLYMVLFVIVAIASTHAWSSETKNSARNLPLAFFSTFWFVGFILTTIGWGMLSAWDDTTAAAVLNFSYGQIPFIQLAFVLAVNIGFRIQSSAVTRIASATGFLNIAYQLPKLVFLGYKVKEVNDSDVDPADFTRGQQGIVLVFAGALLSIIVEAVLLVIAIAGVIQAPAEGSRAKEVARDSESDETGSSV